MTTKDDLLKIREAIKPFAEISDGYKEWRMPWSFFSHEAWPKHIPVIQREWPCDKETNHFRKIYASDFERIEAALTLLDKLIAELESGSVVCMEFKPGTITYVENENPLAWLDDEKVVEMVARVICDEWGYIWDGDADCDDQVAPDVAEYMDERPSKQLYRAAAKAAISCIKRLAAQPTAQGGDDGNL